MTSENRQRYRILRYFCNAKTVAMTLEQRHDKFMPENACERPLTTLLSFFWAVLAMTLSAQSVSESLERTGFKANPLYVFNYPSTGPDGQPVVLSAALAVWQPGTPSNDDAIESVIVGCHITILADYECPTGLKDTIVLRDSYLTACLPGHAYSRPLNRSLVIMPDYEGYGITREHIHPYLDWRTTARQVTDAVRYGLQLYRKLSENSGCPPLASDWKTYCIGYSQGGAAAMATQRYIEENGLSRELHLAGSVCGDGPYDLLGTLRFYIEDDGSSYGVSTPHRRDQLSMPVVLPLIVKGMLDTHPDMQQHCLSDYFSKKFLDTGVIGWIEDKALKPGLQKNTMQIAELFYQQAEKGLTAADGTVYTAREMQQLFVEHKKKTVLFVNNYHITADLRQLFTPECYAYFADAGHLSNLPADSEHPMHALHRALYDNSLCHSWTPQHRIVLLHSRHDQIVPYGNCQAVSGIIPQDKMMILDFSQADHMEAGQSFYLGLTEKAFATYIDWIGQGLPTGTGVTVPADNKRDGNWYTPDGRPLEGQPTENGLYLHQGEKILLHNR